MRKGLFVITILFVITACSNEENLFSGVMVDESLQTRAVVYNSEYLDISTYSFKSMTEEDFFRYSEAEKRMDMKFLENGFIKTNGLSAKELYMSDSLYNFVHKVIDNSNKLLYSANSTDMTYHKTFAKRKSQSSPEPGESNTRKPDCVILAIRHVNGNTKKYDQIENYCDSVFPNWENQGGIATISIQGIMNNFCNLNYTPITGEAFRQKYDDISDTLKFYNKEVAAFERTGSGCKSNEDHCVNVYFLAPGNDKPHFCVFDYQNVTELVKPIDKLTCIFVAP